MKEFLEYQIFSFRDYRLYMYEVIGVAIILLVGYLVDKGIKKIIYKSKRIDKGNLYSVYKISHYVLLIIVFFLIMRILSIDISPLLVGSSAILVGIGLGLQALFLDFISGIILLFDRSIKVGDVLDMNGVMGKVTRITLRTSTLLTTDNREMIFPNSYLIKNSLVNYSSSSQFNSFTIDVGVDYSTDLDLAQQLLIASAKEHLEISHQDKEPLTRIVDFGDYAIVIRLIFFIDNPFASGKIKSDIRRSILDNFKRNNINIPFPITTNINYDKSNERN